MINSKPYTLETDELEAFADMPYRLAQDGFGVPISEQTRQNWSDALVIIQRVDDIVDGGNLAIAKELVDTAEAVLKTSDNEVYLPPHVTLLGEKAISAAWRLKESLPPDDAEKFIRFGGYIIQMRGAMQDESDVATLAAFTGREAELTALMMGAIMSKTERSHPNYPPFMDFLRECGAAYNILDSILDLPADHQTGLTPIEPNLINRLKMIKPMNRALISQLPRIFKLAAKPQIWKMMSEPLRLTYGDRTRGAAPKF